MLSSRRVEHAVRDTESRRKAAFSSVSEQPRRANGDARTSDDHSPQRTGPLNRRVRRLVKRSSATTNACPEFVRAELVANQDFHADLGRGSDLRRPDTPTLMLKKYHV